LKSVGAPGLEDHTPRVSAGRQQWWSAGRGADIILIEHPPKLEGALSDTQRRVAKEWFSRTLYSAGSTTISRQATQLGLAVVCTRK
jgi:hypothetical protein